MWLNCDGFNSWIFSKAFFTFKMEYIGNMHVYKSVVKVLLFFRDLISKVESMYWLKHIFKELVDGLK